MTVSEIARINPDDIGTPRGAFRVELVDDRGKVRERVDSPNYVTPALDQWVKWHQWYAFINGNRYVDQGSASNDVAIPDALTIRDLGNPPRMPIEAIVGTESTVAEDTASDWMTGRVVGWASRYKSNNVPASGARGQINEQQSLMALDSVRLVFDFVEDQGNGSIGSIGMCRAEGLTSTVSGNLLGTLDIATGRSRVTDGTSIDLSLNGRLGLTLSGYLVCNLTDDVLYAANQIQPRAVRIDLTNQAAPDADGFVDLSGVTAADTTEVALAGISSTSTNSAGPAFWNRDNVHSTTQDPVSGDFITAYTDGQGGLCLARHTIAGAEVWKVQVATTPGTSELNGLRAGVTVLGTDVYVVGSGGTVAAAPWLANIHRCNVSDGALTATIPIPNDIQGGTLVPMLSHFINNDGTDLLIHTHEGLTKLTTAGVIVTVYGRLLMTTITATGVTPWDTITGRQRVLFGFPRTYRYHVLGVDDAANTDRHNGIDVIPFTPFPNSTAVIPAFGVRAGRLWQFNYSSGLIRLLSVDGGNCFSRTKLATPINKTSSSTMKWTYEITFPSTWRTLEPHPLPPE